MGFSIGIEAFWTDMLQINPLTALALYAPHLLHKNKRE